MLYTVDNTAKANRPVDKWIDGDGNSYTRDVLEVDTDTGRMVRHKRDSQDRRVLDHSKGEVETETLELKHPLTVIFKNGDMEVYT